MSVDRSPFAEHVRQVTPARRIAGHPQDRVHEQLIVDATLPRRSKAAEKMAFDSDPLLICQCPSTQGLPSIDRLESEL